MVSCRRSAKPLAKVQNGVSFVQEDFLIILFTINIECATVSSVRQKKTPLCVNIPVTLKKKVQKRAKEQDRSVSKVAERLLDDGLRMDLGGDEITNHTNK